MAGDGARPDIENQSAKILVVDDEPDLELLVTQNFRRQIRRGEFTFHFAHDGEDALKVLSENPDVEMVLSDINMPRMDGLTLLGKLDELHEDLAAVIVSAYGDMSNIRTAMNRGAFDFVTKPIEFDDLELTITKTIEHIRHLKRLETARAEAEHDRAILAKFFSPSVMQALQQDPDFLNHGGERRVASFLFTDLANFTPFIENTDPAIVMPLLNEYLGEVTRIILDHEGTITKIVGDAVHAMFGAPLEQADHAARAISCALAIDAFGRKFSERKIADGIDINETRIGVNTGSAIIGNFGGGSFLDYTAHGDAVNTAARLETVNKQLGTTICISQSTVDLVPDFKGRPVGDLVLKGKTESLQAYEPLTDVSYADPRTAAYCAAYDKMAARDASAFQDFAAVVGTYGEDPLSNFHLKRLLAGETGAEITFDEK